MARTSSPGWSSHVHPLPRSIGLLRWTLVGEGNLCSPFEELGTAIIMLNLAFDQDRPTSMLASFFDGVGKFASRRCLQTQPMTVFCIPRRDQAGVIPIFNVVVRAIVDLRFDDIPTVVDEKNEGVMTVANHVRNFLSGQLERAIADHGDQPPVSFKSHGIAEGGRNGPTNRSPLHFNLEPGAIG